MLEVIFQIYINIDPIYLWGINSGKALNEKVLFQKKGSKYQNLEVKCYVSSRVGWKPERKYIKIRTFCLKHFPQSCHMRSIFAKRVVPRKSAFLSKNNFFQTSPRSVWEWSGASPTYQDLYLSNFHNNLLKYKHFSRNCLK